MAYINERYSNETYRRSLTSMDEEKRDLEKDKLKLSKELAQTEHRIKYLDQLIPALEKLLKIEKEDDLEDVEKCD